MACAPGLDDCDGACVILDSQDVVWWHGGATLAVRAARAASQDTAQASSASG